MQSGGVDVSLFGTPIPAVMQHQGRGTPPVAAVAPAMGIHVSLRVTSQDIAGSDKFEDALAWGLNHSVRFGRAANRLAACAPTLESRFAM